MKMKKETTDTPSIVPHQKKLTYTWSDKQWYNFFSRSMVPNSPLMSDATASVQTLTKAIRAHTRHPAAERFINWISAEDFGIHGRFNHVFIPNYVHLPADILTAIGKVTLNVTDVHYHLIWQALSSLRLHSVLGCLWGDE